MATLRDLFPTSQFGAGGAGGGAMQQLYVYNTSIRSINNGGQCCQWTVPSGTTWARFELWGGGGSGPGACCCQQPSHSGGAGAYSRKTISVTPGDNYTICAAGSTNCSPTCCGREGYVTYAQGPNLCMCSLGGPTSCSQCFLMSSGCIYAGHTQTCRNNDYCATADFGLPAISGSARAYWHTCGDQSFQFVPQGPYIGGGTKMSWDYCQTGNGCYHVGSHATFPGGGGGGAVSYGGGCCWGSHGAGGLVIITYR